LMPAKLRPILVSRSSVQVVLRESKSTSPDCKAVKRSLVESGVNFTFCGSPKIAAASARQKSTSRPVQLPLSSGLEKPVMPWLTPHWMKPFCLTWSRVAADAGETSTLRPATRTSVETKRMEQPFLFRLSQGFSAVSGIELFANSTPLLRTAHHRSRTKAGQVFTAARLDGAAAGGGYQTCEGW